MFNGLGMNMGNLSKLSDAKTQSISAENFTGEKGMGGMAVNGVGEKAARDLGQGWKISPCVNIEAGNTFESANISAEGAIQHIWLTHSGNSRYIIMRVYWDGSDYPSIECPVGDFFASAYPEWKDFTPVNSLAVCVNPANGYNCYWEMPFKTRCRITFQNISDENIVVFYQIDYTLTTVPKDCGYFHAQFNRTNPLPYKTDYTILDTIKGKGHYVGTYMAWGSNNNEWWGEGEIKFFLDGDTNYPTICGTGTEDYFCGAYSFDSGDGKYLEFANNYAGLAKVCKTDNLYKCQRRLSLYRWHIMDPIRFDNDIKITMQALGWGNNGRFLPLKDDIASVAFWYQDKPYAVKPVPCKDDLEII